MSFYLLALAFFAILGFNAYLVFRSFQNETKLKFSKFGYQEVSEVTVYDVDDYFCMKCNSHYPYTYIMGKDFHSIFAYLVQAYHLAYTGNQIFKEKMFVTDTSIKVGDQPPFFKLNIPALQLKLEPGYSLNVRRSSNIPNFNKFTQKQIQIMNNVWATLAKVIDNREAHLEIYRSLMTHDPYGKAIERLTVWKHEAEIDITELEEFYLTIVMLQALDVPENDEEIIQNG